MSLDQFVFENRIRGSSIITLDHEFGVDIRICAAIFALTSVVVYIILLARGKVSRPVNITVHVVAVDEVVEVEYQTR